MDSCLDDRKILFLGGVFPKQMEKEIYEKSISNIQNAANNFQWKIIEGLEANIGKPIDILNLMFIGSYPKRYKDIKINSFRFSHVEGANDYNVGFFNLTGIKQIINNNILYKPLNKWIKNNSKESCLIIYSASRYYLKIIKKIKLKYPNLHICLVIPDLPEYTSMHKRGVIFDFIRKSNTQLMMKNVSYVDSFVLLSEHMAKYLNIENKQYVVIEGMVDNNIKSYKINECYHPVKKVITYTGTLTRKYGIMNLVKAFHMIEENNYELVICGDGETKSEILKYASIDKRIKYKGTLMKDEVLKIQRESTILINPRQNNNEYTKYSFPSKTMEYMLSGTPVLMYKLDGIPKEYDNYIYYINDNSIESLKNRILEICNKSQDELNEFGKSAKEFVMHKKNNIIQTKKIINIIG